MDWDKNWINVHVIVQAGGFSGKFSAYVMPIDFKSFEAQLRNLYDKLKGFANFETLEDQIAIRIQGNESGNMLAKCEVMDQAGIGNKLIFEIEFDQSYIPNILRQLENIKSKFPVEGELK